MLGCMQNYFIAWWNLENLFDAEDSPNRRPMLREILKEELQGWNEEILRAKIDQLSKIIVRINNNDGPDILGVCEVEDGPVINKLVDRITELLPRDYKIVHEKYDDKRGIEVAFIYDAAKFEVGKNNHTGEEQIFLHHVLRSEATRNILQVNFRLKTSDNTRLILIGNHWPARTIGELETECFRIAAGDA
jgi:sulfite reductase alpha subunit-like flavoprotein